MATSTKSSSVSCRPWISYWPTPVYQDPPKPWWVELDISRKPFQRWRKAFWMHVEPFQGEFKLIIVYIDKSICWYKCKNHFTKPHINASNFRSFHKLLIEYSETRKFNDENLDTLILTNQGLLRTLGVSHESLEEICRITRQFGAETKLTGAGGGGCAFTFIKAASEYPKEEIQRALEASPFGFKCMESSVGGIGVRWEESMPTRETNNNSKLCIL